MKNLTKSCQILLSLLVISLAGCSYEGVRDEKAEHRGIREEIKVHISSILKCYSEVLKTNPGLHGKIVLQWDIMPDGHVEKSHVKSSELSDDRVGICAANVISSAVFASPQNGTLLTVSYPFFFSDAPPSSK